MSYEPTVTGALLSLVANAQFTSQNTGNIDQDYAATEWLSESEMPSLAEVKAEVENIEAGSPTDKSGLVKRAYRELRKLEYPPLERLADAIYWSERGDSSKLTAYVADCDLVKSRFPKPE